MPSSWSCRAISASMSAFFLFRASRSSSCLRSWVDSSSSLWEKGLVRELHYLMQEEVKKASRIAYPVRSMTEQSSSKSISDGGAELVMAVPAGLGDARRDLFSRWPEIVASRWLLAKERFRDGPPPPWLGIVQAELLVLGVDMPEGVDAPEKELGPDFFSGMLVLARCVCLSGRWGLGEIYTSPRGLRHIRIGAFHVGTGVGGRREFWAG